MIEYKCPICNETFSHPFIGRIFVKRCRSCGSKLKVTTEGDNRPATINVIKKKNRHTRKKKTRKTGG